MIDNNELLLKRRLIQSRLKVLTLKLLVVILLTFFLIYGKVFILYPIISIFLFFSGVSITKCVNTVYRYNMEVYKEYPYIRYGEYQETRDRLDKQTSLVLPLPLFMYFFLSEEITCRNIDMETE